MNRYKAVCSVLIVAPALAVLSTQAHAEFKCDAPQSRVDRVACEHAAEGPDALRHYISRMRPIDSLYFWDYVDEARARQWAANRPETRPARVIVADQAEKPGA
jgi:hypothetical protein